MALLLVSVRSVAEAETALAGGADIIDIKEPSRGSLGRADDATIRAITEHVAGRVPVSAALGDWLDKPQVPAAHLSFVKVGAARSRDRSDWRESLGEFTPRPPPGKTTRLKGAGLASTRFVPVAYADAERASAPAVSHVLDFAVATRCTALLIDTWQKDGLGLLHWLSIKEIASIRMICAARKLTLALAGSLNGEEVQRLLPLKPDIIAVRGAACRAGDRGAAIDLAAVEGLRNMLLKQSNHG